MATTQRTGQCLCGAVRVAAKTSDAVSACHCSFCRTWGGGPLLAVECDGDVEIDGKDHITVFGSSDWAERGFCARCGSHLFYRLKDGGLHAIPVGLFADDGAWAFEQQIFVDQKPAYYGFANQTKELTGAEVFAQFAPQKEGK
jgi:hypothetical protein